MNLRRLAAAMCMLVLCAVLARAGEPPAPAQDKAQHEPIGVRYAEARLKLAELTLKKAQELNKRVPLTIPTPMMSQFADDVTFAKSQIEIAKRNSDGDHFQGWIERAEVDRRTAEAKLKRILETEKAIPGTFTTTDIDRFRIGVELARLRVEQGRALVKGTPEARLQWQLDMLGDAVTRLREQTWLISQNRGPLEF